MLRKDDIHIENHHSQAIDPWNQISLRVKRMGKKFLHAMTTDFDSQIQTILPFTLYIQLVISTNISPGSTESGYWVYLELIPEDLSRRKWRCFCTSVPKTFF